MQLPLKWKHKEKRAALFLTFLESLPVKEFFSVLPPAPLSTVSSLSVRHRNVFACASSLQLQQHHINIKDQRLVWIPLFPSSQDTSPLPQVVPTTKPLKSFKVALIFSRVSLIMLYQTWSSAQPPKPPHQAPTSFLLYFLSVSFDCGCSQPT